MKRTVTLLLCLLLVLTTFSGCLKKKSNTDASGAENDAAVTQSSASDSTAAPSVAPTTDTPTESTEPTEPTEPTEASPTESEAPSDPEPAPTDAAPAPQKTADEVYAEILQTYMDKWDQNPDFIYREYAFHDIDEDGTEELILHDGRGETDRTYYFYTAKNGEAVHLGNCEGWHAALADGDRYITLYAGMNGEGLATRISIAGDALLTEESEAYTFPPTPDFGPQIAFTTY